MAIALVDRCLTLNPSFARGWYWSGVLRNWVGQPDIALEHFETSLRLSPRERHAFYLMGMAIALFFSRRFSEAVVKILEALERSPNYVMQYRFLAACYAHMGRPAEAREIVERLRAITPVVVDSAIRYRNPEYRELYLSGLRLAAGEAV